MSISALTNLFFFVAIISTLCFIIKAILYIMAGTDVEISSDFTSITEHDIHFAYFSLETIFSFFMGFGWGGLVAIQQFSFPAIMSLMLAFIIGCVFFFVSVFLMKFIRNFEHIIKVDPKEAVGQIAKAYTNLEPNCQGQIQLTLNSKLCIKQAFNNTQETIKAFDMIKVVKYENNMLYVEKIK